MKQNIFVFSNTLIRRKQNTIFLEKLASEDEEDFEEKELIEEFFLDKPAEIPTGDKKYIPVENINAIFAIGTINFNSRLLNFLSRNRIPLHVFGTRGNYAGSFLGTSDSLSGKLLLQQAAAFFDEENRLKIAREITTAAVANQLGNLKYYAQRGAFVNEFISEIKGLAEEIKNADSVEELMGYEGIIKRIYFESWRKIFNRPVDFFRRSTNPPPDMINSLISYGNMIVYGAVLNELYLTRLSPEIGFIHSPGTSKQSLCYDIADIFKPIITDRIIFKVINKNILTESDFYVRNGFCRIRKEAKQKFAAEFELKFQTKITYGADEKRFSYRRLIREECYKLIKHFNGETQYTAYIS